MWQNWKRRLAVYWKVWRMTATHAMQSTLINRWTSSLFLFGKAIRFSMTLLLLFLLKNNIQDINGYKPDQVMIFFLTYQILDTLGQMVYRGVYEFSWQVRSGELDFYLAKPLNPLFRILTGKPDIMDTIFFVPTTALTVWLMGQYGHTITLTSVLLYISLLINGFLIVTAFYIFVICIGIVTTEVDNVMMLYRDLNTMGRFPVDMYKGAMRFVLFFVVPVGLMNTIPAQTLLNLPTSKSLLLTYGLGIGFLLVSLGVWRVSVKKYTSAGG
jgi:ABC-2 type transport system permease protein